MKRYAMALFAALICGKASADTQVIKCVSPAGATSYSLSPCKAGHKSFSIAVKNIRIGTDNRDIASLGHALARARHANERALLKQRDRDNDYADYQNAYAQVNAEIDKTRLITDAHVRSLEVKNALTKYKAFLATKKAMSSLK